MHYCGEGLCGLLRRVLCGLLRRMIMWITVKDYVDYCGEGLCGLLRGIIRITVEGIMCIAAGRLCGLL